MFQNFPHTFLYVMYLDRTSVQTPKEWPSLYLPNPYKHIRFKAWPSYMFAQPLPTPEECKFTYKPITNVNSSSASVHCASPVLTLENFSAHMRCFSFRLILCLSRY